MNLRETLLSDSQYRGDFNNLPIEDSDEEFLEYQIGQEALLDIEVQSREIDRLMETAVGLEDLGRVCGFVRDASNVELALIESATTLALAGTGVKTEEILPSLESYIGTEVSTESILKFALNIWKSILKLQRRIWKSTVRFYNSTFRSVPKLRKSVEDLKIRAEGVKEKSLKEGKIDLGNATATLSRDYTAMKSADELKDNLEFYNSFTATLLGEYTTMAAERGEVISKNLKEDVFERSDKIVELAKLMMLPKNPLKNSISRSPMKLNSSDLSKDERFNSDDQYKSPMGLSIYQSKYFITDDTTVRDIDAFLKENDYGKLEDVEKTKVAVDALECANKNKTEIVMAYSSTKKPKLPKKESVDPITYSDVEAIADHILMICDYVELNSSSDKIKELEKISNSIEESCKKLANGMSKQDTKSGSLASVWRLVANVNVAWLNMVTKPQSQWTNHVFAVSRATIGVCSKSLSMYE